MKILRKVLQFEKKFFVESNLLLFIKVTTLKVTYYYLLKLLLKEKKIN